jgi:aminopeptidase N
LNDPFYQIRIDAIKQCNRLKQDHKAFLLEKIPALALNDEKSLVRQAAVAFLNTHYPNETITKEVNTTVLNNDLSYKVIGSALIYLSKYDFDGAMQKAKQLENEKSGSMMNSLATLYADHGTAEQYPFFQKAFSSNLLSGTNLYNTISSFGLYLTRQPAIIQEQALNELGTLLNGGAYSAFFAKYALQNVIYSIELAIKNLDLEILAHEKEKDFLQAQQKTKEKLAFQEVLKKYAGLL